MIQEKELQNLLFITFSNSKKSNSEFFVNLSKTVFFALTNYLLIYYNRLKIGGKVPPTNIFLEVFMKLTSKKLLAALCAVAMVVTMVAAMVVPMFTVTATAAENTAMITFDSTEKRTAFDAEHQVWEENGITLTNNKAGSSSAVADYANPARFYKSSEAFITCAAGNITQIVFTCSGSNYAKAPTVTGGTATTSGTTITITMDAPTSEVHLVFSGSQVRAKTMTVTYEAAPAAPDAPVEPSLSLSGDNFVCLGDTLALTAKLENSEETLVWSSSNETAATVDQNGVVTPVAMGTTTITVTAGELSKEKTIKVFPAAGEITVAEALAICNFVGSETAPVAYTVKGVIEKIDTAYDATYKNLTVTVTDGTGSLMAFRMKGTGADSLVVGDEIVVTGYLKKYNSTPEFDAGCTFTMSTAAAAASAELGYRYADDFKNSKFSIRFTVDADLANVEADAFGICVKVNGNDIFYNAETSKSWTEDEETGEFYITVNLGDIANNAEKLALEITAAAYVTVGETTVVSANAVTCSVASLVEDYYADEYADEEGDTVEELYNHLVELGVIAE